MSVIEFLIQKVQTKEFSMFKQKTMNIINDIQK